jgi:hypothetical protein
MPDPFYITRKLRKNGKGIVLKKLKADSLHKKAGAVKAYREQKETK